MSENTVDLTDLRPQIDAYKTIKEQIKVLSETADTLALDIKAALGEREVGTLDGAPVVTYKHTKRSVFSQKLLRATRPEVYEECKETTEVRAFRLADS